MIRKSPLLKSCGNMKDFKRSRLVKVGCTTPICKRRISIAVGDRFDKFVVSKICYEGKTIKSNVGVIAETLRSTIEALECVVGCVINV